MHDKLEDSGGSSLELRILCMLSGLEALCALIAGNPLMIAWVIKQGTMPPFSLEWSLSLGN